LLACENRYPNKEMGLTCPWSAMGGGNGHCMPGKQWFPSRICKYLLHQSIYINCWLFYHVSTSINSRLSQTNNGFIVIPCVFLSTLTRQRELWTIYLVWKHQISCFFQTGGKRLILPSLISLLILSDIAKSSWKYCR
jgi:hypothetical protein